MKLYECKWDVLYKIQILVDEFQLDINEINFKNSDEENKLFTVCLKFNEKGKEHEISAEFTKDRYKNDLRDFVFISENLLVDIFEIT